MQLFFSPYIKPNAMTCIRTVIKFWTQDAECVVCVCLHTTWIMVLQLPSEPVSLLSAERAGSQPLQVFCLVDEDSHQAKATSSRCHRSSSLLTGTSRTMPALLTLPSLQEQPRSAPPGQGLSIWALLVPAQRFSI